MLFFFFPTGSWLFRWALNHQTSRHRLRTQCHYCVKYLIYGCSQGHWSSHFKRVWTQQSNQEISGVKGMLQAATCLPTVMLTLPAFPRLQYICRTKTKYCSRRLSLTHTNMNTVHVHTDDLMEMLISVCMFFTALRPESHIFSVKFFFLFLYFSSRLWRATCSK